VARLGSGSYYERVEAQAALERLGSEGMAVVRRAIGSGRLDVLGRLHAIWALARTGGTAAVGELVELARTDNDARIQAQAMRAVGDLADPVLVRHRLDAGPGDPELAARIAELAKGRDPRVIREVVIAVGRLGWPSAPYWLRSMLMDPDAALAHAAVQTMRRSTNWPAILSLLDEPSSESIRALALRAIAEQAVPSVVDDLIHRLRGEKDPARRLEYADALARVFKKPGRASYWGYRPPPRPANTVAWERTEAITQAHDRLLVDRDRAVRLAVLKRMRRERVTTRPETLGRWLREEHDAEAVAAILDSMSDFPAEASREPLWRVVTEGAHCLANRLRSFSLWTAVAGEAGERDLSQRIGALEDGPVLAEVLKHLGRRRQTGATPILVAKLRSRSPEVRAAAIEALAELRAGDAGGLAGALLQDQDAGVRRAAVAAVGTLGVRSSIERLLTLSNDGDPGVRRLTRDALRQLREPRAVPLAIAALSDRETEVPALRCIGELAGVDDVRAVVDHARQNPSAAVLPLALNLLSEWAGRPGLAPSQKPVLHRAVAELQGASGCLLCWQVTGPVPAEATAAYVGRMALPGRAPEPWPGVEGNWRTQLAKGIGTAVPLVMDEGSKATAAWLAITEIAVPEVTDGQILVSSNAGLRIRLNGRLIHEHDPGRGSGTTLSEFGATLPQGMSRLLVEIVSARSAEFRVSLRRRSSSALRERLMQAALTVSGDPARGREIFFDTEKSQCLKCHQIDGRGERIGPELTGVGSRFSRIFIIESILDPGRVVAPSFATVTVALKDGRVLSGVRTAQTDRTFTLADQQGQKHELARSGVEQERPQAQSTMPEGLEKRFTTAEFIDLIAFLAAQK
jgi:putative heme-binding domain-containing protein